ncbi:MAG: methionine--tRNA ligase [Thermosulfidibacteraceae bacterium]|jgi:methionyl-tRNA synthetase
MKKFYITTPIYYVNDIPHVGHAYTTIAADVMARYKRVKGYDVFFLTGTDEHGQKIEKAARSMGLAPKELADKVVVNFKKLWERLGIGYSHFIRTTDFYHEEGVSRIFEMLYKKGDIYLGEYEGWYCVPCETFWAESQLGSGNVCPDCGRPVEKLKEKSYFFRLSAYQDRLLEFYEKNPDFVRPQGRMNEIVSFVKRGLEDISVSRTTFKWGIPVPFDKSHVIYVWFDALFNYVTGIGYGWDEEKFKKYWPADIHFIGKDILRFHAIYWPAFLMACGLEPPRRIFAHGWWTVEGRKMSKSLRNIVDPNKLIDQFGADVVRYFLMREVPFGLDGDFSHKALVTRINSELANDLGNLFHRVIAMTERYFKGTVPPYFEGSNEVRTKVNETLREYEEAMENQAFSRALEATFNLVRYANRYVDTKAPWELYKSGKLEELGEVLYELLEIMRITAILCYPFMPLKSREMFKKLGVDKVEPEEEDFNWGGLKGGERVAKGDPLFVRVDEEEVLGKVLKEIEDAEKEEKEEMEEFVSIEDFVKLKLVVAEVIEAERVKNSSKLIKLILNIGNERRTVVAGIGGSYEPSELVGKKVIYFSNLKPKKIRGIESQGMILAAGNEERIYLPILPEDTPVGSPVK